VPGLMLADEGGPAYYLGGSIETFVLPMAAFIVIATVLYVIYRRPHLVPRLRYMGTERQTSFATSEPGPVPAPAVRPEGVAGQAAAGDRPAGGAPAAPGAPAASGDAAPSGGAPADGQAGAGGAGRTSATGASAPEGPE